MLAKFIALSILSFSMSAAYAAAPTSYKGYCMIVQTGDLPTANVAIHHGETKELFNQGGFTYSIGYIDDLGGKNVLEVKVLNQATGLQNLSRIYVENEMPKQLDFVTEMFNFTCIRD